MLNCRRIRNKLNKKVVNSEPIASPPKSAPLPRKIFYAPVNMKRMDSASNLNRNQSFLASDWSVNNDNRDNEYGELRAIVRRIERSTQFR